MSLLTIDGVSKSFGHHKALHEVSLTIEPGEFVSLLGPSGCGKTTLLRLIAGFMEADTGAIHMEGQDLTGLPPHRRPLNTVFQNYALFPHLSVLDNVAYGPRRGGASKQDAADHAREALLLVGLADLEDRYPREMSGGQQQRVALARAVVNRPKLLLLDEPLSALDLKLRKRMQIELKQLQEKLGCAFVFVTHDQEEAMTMSDRIAVLHAGRIEQVGNGAEIYRRPRTRFVAEFIGDANLVPVGLDDAGRTRILSGGSRAMIGTAVLRPEHLVLTPLRAHPPVGDVLFLDGRVENVTSVGGVTNIYVHAEGHDLVARRLGLAGSDVAVGMPATLEVRWHDLHVLADGVA
jgi:spermidine/putrescine transport system ATP-binding protein